MREIHDYQILTAETPSELGGLVRTALEFGWQPLGSHQVICGSHDTTDSTFVQYSQTLVSFGPKMGVRNS